MSLSPPPSTRPLWQRIFISPNEPRLRAFWRLALQTLLLIIILVVLTIPLSLLLLLLFRLSPTGMAVFIGGSIVSFVAYSLSVYLARRLLDRRSFTSLGLQLDRRVLPDLLAGIVITFVIMGLVYLALSLLGWIDFRGFAWQVDPIPIVIGQLFLFLVVFILVGWQEELLSRGYHLQTLASGTNLFWGVGLSSVIFGALHLGNPHATWASAVGIFFAGLFLALAYLRTGRLWLSIGLHFGWNFFEGIVFGFPVSGLATYPLLRIQIRGPAVWTGGTFGPEAGLIVLPALAIGAGLIWLYTHFRGVEKPDTR